MSVYRLKGTAGVVINKAFRLSGTIVIGRADDCDIRIEDERIAAHHVEVKLGSQGGVQLRELDSESGVKVNGEKVQIANLASGDEIHIGNCRLMLQAPGLRPERVLSGDAIQEPRKHWPWLLVIALAGMVILGYTEGWMSVISNLFG